MSFDWPLALLGLLAVPLTAALYVLAQRRRRRYAVRFTNMELLGSVVTESPGWRRHLPPLLFLLALAALVIAIARPHVEVDVAREEATVMLTTDSSGSMQATDVEPNRLDAGKEAAKGFVDQLPDEFRLGLVSFSNISQLLVPPTDEREPVRVAIDGLQAEGGTAIGSALETSLSALRPVVEKAARDRSRDRRGRRRPTPAVVVLLSDGYSTTGPDPLEVARRAREQRVPVSTVALGTSAATVTLLRPPRRHAHRPRPARQAHAAADRRDHGRPILPRDRPRQAPRGLQADRLAHRLPPGGARDHGRIRRRRPRPDARGRPAVDDVVRAFAVVRVGRNR